MDIVLVTFKANGDRCDIVISAPTTTFGRHADCDVQIPQTGVSRRHFQILVQDEKVKIKDLGSTNGTFLNEQRITMADVAAGDKIRTAEVYFTVIINGQPSEIARHDAAPQSRDNSQDAPTMPLEEPPPAPVSSASQPAQLEEPPDEDPTDPLGALAAMGKPPKQ